MREVVRLVQEARKNSGLEVSDRIELWWTGDGVPAEALEEHAEQWAGEVLATTVHAGTAGDGPGIEGPAGSRFWLARAWPSSSGLAGGVLRWARARSASVRSGEQTAHGVKPSVRASSSGQRDGLPAGEPGAARHVVARVLVDDEHLVRAGPRPSAGR